MDRLQEILNKKELKTPAEIGLIKDYVRRKYKSECSVKLKHGALIVSVSNSALAATLQLERPQIIRACNIKDKKLVIRNG